VYGRRFVPVWLGWATAVGLAASFAAMAIHRNQDLATPIRRTPRDESTARGRPAGGPPAAASAPAVPRWQVPRRPVRRRQAPASAGLINGLLAANSANTSDAAAFRRLLSLWGTAMTNDRDPCGQAQKAGLACLEQRGSWAQVRT